LAHSALLVLWQRSAADMLWLHLRAKYAAQRANCSAQRFTYITIAFLLLDPLYLSILCGFFGGGDMNGIDLLCPEWAARCLFGVLLIANALVFWKRVLPVYKKSFAE
jgi:hypothetical protein